MFKKIFIILIATFIFAQYLSTSYGAGAVASQVAAAAAKGG